MQRPPRSPNEPLLTPKLLWRILIISAFNVVAVFGIFEWTGQTTGNLTLARTMAVQTLVAAATFYLLSISQFVPSLVAHLSDRRQPVAYVPAIGIVAVFLLQVLFSQLPLMNPLFDTQPLTFHQALHCIGAGFPIVLPALLLRRWAPLI